MNRDLIRLAIKDVVETNDANMETFNAIARLYNLSFEGLLLANTGRQIQPVRTVGYFYH